MQPSPFLKITPEDFDAGFFMCPVRYRRGEPQAGWPDEIQLTVPPLTEVNQIVESFTESQDPYLFALACLPVGWRTAEFLNSLAYDSHNQLLDACITLCLGEELKNKIYQMNAVSMPKENALEE